MNREDWLFVISCVLGDGSLTPIRNKNTVMISFTHCEKQRSWLQEKADRLNQIFGRSCTVGFSSYFDERTGNRYESCQFALTSQKLIPAYQLIYPQGKKVFSKALLTDLTCEHLAVLWADDGSLEPKHRVGRLNLYEPQDQCQLVIDWIQSICGAVGRYEDYQGEGVGRLRFPPSEMMKITLAISPYIHHSMIYKIDMQYKRNTSIRQAFLIASSPIHLPTLDTLPLVDDLKHKQWEALAKKLCIADTRNKSKIQLRECIVQVLEKMSGQ